MNRRFLLILITIPFLCLVFFAGIFGISEWKLSNVTIPPPFEYSVKLDSTTINRGKHLARTRGCFSCHGPQLAGNVITDQWDWVDVAVAPNLAKYAREQNASSIESAVRHGIGVNRQSLWSMPSYNWANLSDNDMAAIIAYLQSAPIVEKELDEANLGFSARWDIAFGNEPDMATWAAKVKPIIPDPSKTASYLRGQYIALTTCNECHGINLHGENSNDIFTPDLTKITSYPEASFRTLMKEGIALNGKRLGLMSIVAKDRFSYFTDQELYDLYTFLKTFIEGPKQ